MNAPVKLWLARILLVGMCLSASQTSAAESLSENRSPISKVLKAENKEHAKEIRKVIGTELPEGYVLEVDYSTWVDGSMRPRGYTPTRAVPKNAEGVIDGTVRYWVPDGPSRTIEYREGKKHGAEKAHGRSGRLHMECTWQEDKLHGVKKTYNDKGNVASETTYEHGVPVGESRSYDPVGKVIERTPYRNGVRDGERIQYWPDSEDTPRRITPYVEGAVQGTVREFYQDGTLRKTIQFVNGRPHGIEMRYDEKGKETRKRYWLEGDIVPKGKFDAEYKEDNEATQGEAAKQEVQ